MKAVSLRCPMLLLFAGVSACGACAIQGTVVDSLSGRAVPNAQVFVRPHGEETAVPVRRITDGSGRFCFERLEAGDYEVNAKRAGYLNASYGQRRPSGPGLVLRISAEQALPPLTVKMTPEARISGRLVDSGGDPIDGAEIELLRRSWINGKFQPAPAAQVPTDDQGRFRLGQLAPGTYFVSARPGLEFRRREFLNDKGEPIREREIETYYNGSLSLQDATPVALKAGQEIAGLTLTLQKAGGRHISGRIAIALSEGERAWVQIIEDTEIRRRPVGHVWINKDGRFRVDGLLTSQYLVWGRIFRGDSTVQLEKQVDLRNGDAEGIVLEPVQPVELEVRVRVDGATTISKVPPIQQIYLAGNSMHGSQGELQPNGTYKFEDVFPGVYEIEIATEGNSYFVKRVLVDGEVQADRKLDVQAGRPKSIEVILSSRVAAIKGQVARNRELTTGTMIILWDELEQSQSRSQVAGPNGEFEFKSLPPGKYRLYAFEDFDSDSWGSPELAVIFASKSVALDLHEGENRQVTLPLISAKEFQDALQRIGF